MTATWRADSSEAMLRSWFSAACSISYSSIPYSRAHSISILYGQAFETGPVETLPTGLDVDLVNEIANWSMSMPRVGACPQVDPGIPTDCGSAPKPAPRSSPSKLPAKSRAREAISEKPLESSPSIQDAAFAALQRGMINAVSPPGQPVCRQPVRSDGAPTPSVMPSIRHDAVGAGVGSDRSLGATPGRSDSEHRSADIRRSPYVAAAKKRGEVHVRDDSGREPRITGRPEQSPLHHGARAQQSVLKERTAP